MVFEIKKTAMKINKATPIKLQFRMKVPAQTSCQTPPSLTSETPSRHQPRPCFLYIFRSCCLYINKHHREDYISIKNLPVVPSRGQVVASGWDFWKHVKFDADGNGFTVNLSDVSDVFKQHSAMNYR